MIGIWVFLSFVVFGIVLYFFRFSVSSIVVGWKSDWVRYRLSSHHLNPELFEVYDPDYLEQHRLPKGPISFRYHPEQSVLAEDLQKEVEIIVAQVTDKSFPLKNLCKLKDAEFNESLREGFLIIKMEKYPFVVKLFITSPKSFVHPMKITMMSALYFLVLKLNRHLFGLTRIRNRNLVMKKLQENSFWKSRVDAPRKWFWVAENSQSIVIATHFAQHPDRVIEIPSIYAIIEDAIDFSSHLSLWKERDRKLSLHLCNFLHHQVDSHPNSFVYEKETNKVVILDTEELPVVIKFFSRKVRFRSYMTLAVFAGFLCVENLLGIEDE
jgi:hypothetical protein